MVEETVDSSSVGTEGDLKQFCVILHQSSQAHKQSANSCTKDGLF